MSEIFFTADHHFGNKNIIQLADRPFRTLEHMEETLIQRHNSVVGHDDEVWFLGDFALTSEAEMASYLARLHGRKYLIPGNHDACFRGKPSGASKVEKYLHAGFQGVLSSGFIPMDLNDWNGPIWNLSHFPYDGDSQREDRYVAHRMAESAVPLLHGHTHEKALLSLSKNLRTVQINVGVDQWGFYPVSMSFIKTLFGVVQNLDDTEVQVVNMLWKTVFNPF